MPGCSPGLLQDDCRELSRWLAERAGAYQCVRERVAEIHLELLHCKVLDERARPVISSDNCFTRNQEN